MRYTLAVFFLLMGYTLTGQSSDFLALKKKGKAIRSYYAGTQITFVTKNGVFKDALINKISHDSIFIQEFMVQPAVTQFGFYVLDTVGSFHYAYPYKEIGSIGQRQKGFNVRGSGAALLGGGILLTVASGVVFLADREKFSPELLIASAGLGVIGYFLGKAGSKGIILGKRKYRLEYINMTK